MDINNVIGLLAQRGAKDGISKLQEFRSAQESGGLFVDCVPLYSRVSLRGYANPTTAAFAPQTIRFFNAVAGQAGVNGFGQNRALTQADTNLTGQGGVVPGGTAYVMTQIGVEVAPEAPQQIKDAIVYNSALTQYRGANNQLPWGTTQFYPAAEFGVQAAAAASTVANTTINQATNGRSAMITLPPSSYIVLPPNQPIDFRLEVFVPFFVTQDGLTQGANNIIANDGVSLTNETEIQAYLTLVLRGFRYTTVGI